MSIESIRLAKNAIKFEIWFLLGWARHNLGFIPRFLVNFFDVSWEELDELEQKGW